MVNLFGLVLNLKIMVMAVAYRRIPARLVVI